MVYLLALIIVVLTVGIVLQILGNQRLRKRIESLDAEKKDLQEKQMQFALTVQENERREIGQDLHDELGSTLLSMKMNLSLIEKQGLFIFESSDALKELKYSLDHAIDYVRSVSREISPAFLEKFGLRKAVEQLVKRLNTSCVARVHFEEKGHPFDLSKYKQLHLYRIIQESVSNALHHGSPWHIYIDLIWEKNNLVVEVRDDGYDYKLKNKKWMENGLGMNNITNRARMIGAHYDFSNSERGNLSRTQIQHEEIEKN
jgi:signal transduction histidine kinase